MPETTMILSIAISYFDKLKFKDMWVYTHLKPKVTLLRDRNQNRLYTRNVSQVVITKKRS